MSGAMPEKIQMVIANRLRDGLTVFLGDGDIWVESIGDGIVAQNADAAAALLRTAEVAADRNVVVSPYLIAIREGDRGRSPIEWREAIRAFGPTVETGRTV
jgi:hypothetical protein